MAQRYDRVCPYCGVAGTIHPDNRYEGELRFEAPPPHKFELGNDGKRRPKVSKGTIPYRFQLTVESCPNPKCRRFSANYKILEPFAMDSFRLVKQGSALPGDTIVKSLPLCDVPQAVIDDYEEAQKILELSPKAACTLARRAVQGMIRDFHGIQKGTLNAELLALEKVVDADVWKAIDAMRTVGNVGAHMEKDVNTIVDVDPGEADLLIKMIELLCKEWYLARHRRNELLENVQELAGKVKTQQGKNGKQPDK